MNTAPLLWWGVGKTVFAGATRAVASLRSYGTERVPREGGAVLASNHLHWLDPPVLGTICPRRIVFVAKVELHSIPGMGELIRSFGTLAVRRGESDREAVRLAREAVRRNELLGMFVEGTRQKAGEPGKAMPGAAMVAMQEGVPIVPVAIYGSNLWRPGTRAPISVAWGEPMRFEELPRNSKGYRAATAEVEAEIRRLWEFLRTMHALGRPRGAPPRRAHVPSKTP